MNFSRLALSGSPSRSILKFVFVLSSILLFASVASVQAQFTISGKVTEVPAISGVAIPGVTVVVTLNGNVQTSVQTDSGGNFSFPNITPGSNYDVTLSKPNYTFTPNSQGGTNIQANQTIYFTGQATTATTVQFSAATPSTENNTAITIRVNRSGDTTGTSTVKYSTSDTAAANPCSTIGAGASSRCDYLTTLGTLQFAAGETSKTISIPIIDDVYAEGSENFTITLTNPTGATLGATATATLTIIDNDATNGTTNPIDGASFFVRQHYVDFLNREPNTSGLNFWTNEITQCGADAACTELKRINVSAAFFLSIEFQETGYLVYRTFATAFGPTRIGGAVPLTLTEFLPDVQRIGQGVVIGEPGADALLEANKQAYFNEFVTRPQFLGQYPVLMPRDQFVTLLNTNAGGALSPAEVNSLVTGGQTRAQVLRAVAEDSDLINAHFNRAFVLMQYFGYLRRSPNDLPNSDFSGYNFWLGKLDQFGGNFVNAEMVKAFITSGEYRHRFAPQ